MSANIRWKQPFPRLYVGEMVAWPEGQEPNYKFVVLETYLSVQGPRERICQRFRTREEAEHYMNNPEAFMDEYVSGLKKEGDE